MKLIGSIASPFVRKVRILLDGTGYEFDVINVFSKEGQQRLQDLGPLRRVPILIDDEKSVLFDSNIICEYLLDKKKINLDIKQKLKVKIIDEGMDAAVILIQQKMLDADKDWQTKYSKNILKRLNDILNYLDTTCEIFKEDSYEAISLFCLLDYLEFRDIVKWKEKYRFLNRFYDVNKDKHIFRNTNPRT